MTSIVGHKPAAALGEALPEWAKFDWQPKTQHDIYRDWGTYYSSRRRENFSKYYYTMALELVNDDSVSLYRRSLTRSKLAEIAGSLEDARRAAEMTLKTYGHNCLINLQICDSIFQLNQFENCKKEICDNLRRFTGNKVNLFETRRGVLYDVIRDTTNKSLSLFYLNNQKTVKKVSAILRAKEKIDDRPKWKILKELDICDVLSIPDEKPEALSPLEMARRERAFNVVHQSYMNLSWKDFLFMRLIFRNPNLLLDICKYSKEHAGPLTKTKYDVIRRFRQMLQARNPLYFLNSLKSSNRKTLAASREAVLFRIQYQTHRNMIRDLRQIRLLREEKRVEKLADYIEQIMGDYYITKTNRVMCWKFEFINEVYNTLALALCEQYQISKHRITNNPFLLLLKYLRLKQDTVKDVLPFVFGDRSTYQEAQAENAAIKKARLLVTRLEKRNGFAKYSIEKCYIYHQIASNQLKQLRYTECIQNAHKAIKECQNCNSSIWQFLSLLQIIKANALQYKIETTKEVFDEIMPVVEHLKSKSLVEFIENCLSCVDAEIRKKTETLVANSRTSRSSFYSSFMSE